MTLPKRQSFFLGNELPHTPRVLVADDDWLNRDLLETYLKNAGCEVISCADGQEAWESYQRQPPDIALLDIAMPGMDGLTLCRHIKENEATGYIPVVIVTALDAEDEKLRSLEVGADDFIGKPYSTVVLLTRVRSLLRTKRLHHQLEERNQLLREVLNRYVDKDIAEVILQDPERHLKLGGDNRFITVLFADLRGFTPFTETNPAEQVVETLNLVFNELTEIVYRNGGTFDKYMGDSIMAFYGAPIREPDDIQRALRTGLEMQERFKELQKEKEILGSLGIGVGVHAGEAIVGNIGSERVMDYTVIGDTVNVARRLQEMARPGEILISEEVHSRVPSLEVKHLTTQHLPGRSEPMRLYGLKSF
ncbi:MAG: adenylate/guanylate cyclase domain-containing response regulator [Chloroflexi bacterium]|nr:MAG: adenylate/guanylate cyclase domain-containing response regulator [Chloroflexota bacterium]MBL1194233.1 adenylate/guanylate cyclase domain-containing response regulator [Chloroflexota bacterium]NOH11526.1 response regulator [Chloroflexota bacterium]